MNSHLCPILKSNLNYNVDPNRNLNLMTETARSESRRTTVGVQQGSQTKHVAYTNWTHSDTEYARVELEHANELYMLLLKTVGAYKGNAFLGHTSLESIKMLSFATVTNVIGPAVN